MSFDIAVVIPTACRHSLLRAVRSIYQQSYTGTIQILIGIDRDPDENWQSLQEIIFQERPSRVNVTVVNLGYSTSKRFGGCHSNGFGGNLRTILTFAANSDIVSYLDDDDWYEPNHIALLLEVIEEKSWAFSLCYFCDSALEKKICIDSWESVGPGRGVYAATFGGFVRPSGLVVNRAKIGHLLYLWGNSMPGTNRASDRVFFNGIKNLPYGQTQIATVNYSMDPADETHQVRLEIMRKMGHDVSFIAKGEQSFRKEIEGK